VADHGAVPPFALEPAVNWLVGRGWKRGAASAAVLFGLLLTGLMTMALMVPLVIDQIQELVDRVPIARRSERLHEAVVGPELSDRSASSTASRTQTDIQHAQRRLIGRSCWASCSSS
jgi:predicted PurR-regulated permease PerM